MEYEFSDCTEYVKNEKGSGNMYCNSCLASDRILKNYGLEDVVYKTLHLNLGFEPWKYYVLSLCWECRAVVRKFLNFKARALLALQSLEGAIEIKPLTDLKSSQLAVQVIEPADRVDIEKFDVKVEISNSGSDNLICENLIGSQRNEELEVKLSPRKVKGRTKTRRSERKKKESKKPPELLVDDEVLKEEAIASDGCYDDHHTSNECPSDDDKDPSYNPSTIDDKEWIEPPKPWIDKYRAYIMGEAEMIQVLEEERHKNRYLSLPYKCETCIWSYIKEDDLVKHNKRFHTEKKGYVCCDICKRYLHPAAYKSHRNEHYTMYVCTLCAGRCYRETKQHYSRRHGVSHYTCVECGGGFATERAFRYHCTLEHGGKYPCGVCGKVYSTRDTQKEHEATHKEVPSEVCPTCQLQIKGKYAFTNHVLRHNETKISGGSVPAGERTESKPDRSENYCAECDKQFKDEQLYRQHLTRTLKHLAPGDRKFPCPDCDRKFVSTYFVKIHRVRAHVKTRDIACDICNKKYLTRIDLSRHVKYVHDKWRPARDKMCSYCGKAFLTKQNLDQHIRTHTGERPYQCTLCAATFTHQGSLVTHNKLVHLKIKRKRNPNAKKRRKAKIGQNDLDPWPSI